MNTLEAKKYIYALNDLKNEQEKLNCKRYEYQRIERKLIQAKKSVKFGQRIWWHNLELRENIDFCELLKRNEYIYNEFKNDFKRISNSLKIQKSIVNDRQRVVSFYHNKD